MKNRRLGQYGSSSDKHAMRAGMDWEAGKAAIKKANAHLQSGNCSGALAQLKNAAFNMGAATSEVQGAVGHAKAMKGERGSLNVLADRIQAKCLKTHRDLKRSSAAANKSKRRSKRR